MPLETMLTGFDKPKVEKQFSFYKESRKANESNRHSRSLVSATLVHLSTLSMIRDVSY